MISFPYDPSLISSLHGKQWICIFENYFYMYLYESFHACVNFSFILPTYNSMTGLSYLILETAEFSCMACGHAISWVWGEYQTVYPL